MMESSGAVLGALETFILFTPFPGLVESVLSKDRAIGEGRSTNG